MKSVSSKPLHICFVAHEYHEDFRDPEQLLEVYHSLTEWCEALHQCACKVTAVVRFKADVLVQKNGVDYHFVKDRYGPQLSFWQIPRKMHRVVLAQQADIVHAHNFNKVLQHRDLLQRLRKSNQTLLLQNHGETPRFYLRNILQARVFSQTHAFLFCAKGQEKVWQEQRIFTSQSPLYYVMEGSTHFRKNDRTVSRQSTGLQGDPVVLWVGHLNLNKDPLTVMHAFRQMLESYPEARLYMIYRQADLMEEVQSFLQTDERLKKATFLLGEKNRSDLEAYYNSADYFVLGSHREGSGYAALEAIACGCIPILTDIHSYRMMTADGTIGPLWTPGDVDALVQAMQQAFALPIEEQSKKVQDFFEQQLSYSAIAQTMIGYYREVIDRVKTIGTS